MRARSGKMHLSTSPEKLKRRYKNAIRRNRMNSTNPPSRLNPQQRRIFFLAARELEAEKKKAGDAAKGGRSSSSRRGTSSKNSRQAARKEEGNPMTAFGFGLLLFFSGYIVALALSLWALAFWMRQFWQRPISASLMAAIGVMSGLANVEHLSWERMSFLWFEFSSPDLGLGADFNAAVEAVALALIGLAIVAPITRNLIIWIGEFGSALLRQTGKIAMVPAASITLALPVMVILGAGAVGAPAMGAGPASDVSEGIALAMSEPLLTMERGSLRFLTGLQLEGLRIPLIALTLGLMVPIISVTRLVYRNLTERTSQAARPSRKLHPTERRDRAATRQSKLSKDPAERGNETISEERQLRLTRPL